MHCLYQKYVIKTMFLKENWKYSDMALWIWHTDMQKQTPAIEMG